MTFANFFLCLHLRCEQIRYLIDALCVGLLSAARANGMKVMNTSFFGLAVM